MKTIKILAFSLLLFSVSCSSVKSDTSNYELKNDIFYYKNDTIGYLKKSDMKETAGQIDKKYSIIFYENINKDLILRKDIINYFLKKYSDDNSEVEVYTTLVK